MYGAGDSVRKKKCALMEASNPILHKTLAPPQCVCFLKDESVGDIWIPALVWASLSLVRSGNAIVKFGETLSACVGWMRRFKHEDVCAQPWCSLISTMTYVMKRNNMKPISLKHMCVPERGSIWVKFVHFYKGVMSIAFDALHFSVHFQRSIFRHL